MRVGIETSMGTAVALGVVASQEPGNVLEFSGNVAAATFQAAVDAADAGPLTVRPTTGQSSFTVTGGDFIVRRQNLTIQQAVIRDIYTQTWINQGPALDTADGFTIKNSSVHSFMIDSADGWLIDNCTCDFGGVNYNNFNGGSICLRFSNSTIRNSSFSNCYVTADPDQHTEAWFITAGCDGLLFDNCVFNENGTTGHIFWSFFDFNPTNPTPNGYPQNICVTNTDFTNSHNPFFHCQLRAELQGQPLNNRLNTTTCTFDASAGAPMGNEGGEYTAWNLPCSSA